MKLSALVLVAVAAVSAAAADKPKGKDQAAAQKADTVQDVLKRIDEKVAGGDVDNAISMLRQAIEKPDAAGALSLKLGQLLEEKADIEGAVEVYKSLADKSTGSVKGEALARQSMIAEAWGSGDANAAAEAAIAADPEGTWPLLAQAHMLARQGKGSEALAAAQKAVAGNAGAAAQVAVGCAQEASGDGAAAEAAYREALAARPADLGASLGLARILRKSRRAVEAVPILKQVIDKAPGAVPAYKESARAQLAMNEPARAAEDAQIAAALVPDDKEAQALIRETKVARALAYLSANQADIALQDLQELTQQEPQAAEAHLGLARVYLVKRQSDAALAAAKKAVELDPQSAEAHYYAAFIVHAKGDAAASLGDYEKAAALDPTNVEYRTKLGAVLADSKVAQYDRAVAELTKVVEGAGSARADSWLYLGGAHLAAKRYQPAVGALSKALALCSGLKSEQEKAETEKMVSLYLAWAYSGLKDSANFKKYGARARELGYKDPAFLKNLSDVEGGAKIK